MSVSPRTINELRQIAVDGNERDERMVEALLAAFDEGGRYDR